MKYYINVSLRGQHLFRTDECDYYAMVKIFDAISLKFSKKDGYEVLVCKHFSYTKSSYDLESLKSVDS